MLCRRTCSLSLFHCLTCLPTALRTGLLYHLFRHYCLEYILTLTNNALTTKLEVGSYLNCKFTRIQNAPTPLEELRSHALVCQTGYLFGTYMDINNPLSLGKKVLRTKPSHNNNPHHTENFKINKNPLAELQSRPLTHIFSEKEFSSPLSRSDVSSELESRISISIA